MLVAAFRTRLLPHAHDELIFKFTNGTADEVEADRDYNHKEGIMFHCEESAQSKECTLWQAEEHVYDKRTLPRAQELQAAATQVSPPICCSLSSSRSEENVNFQPDLIV